MDSSMFAIDIGVAAVLCGVMIAYTLYTWKEVDSMRVEDAFQARRFYLPIAIAAVIYALIAVAGLSVSMLRDPRAIWVTIAVLCAFAAVDLIRGLLEARRLRQQGAQGHSAAAAAVAPIVSKSTLWMLLYTLLQAANLVYFT